jgi:hypothetical protein
MGVDVEESSAINNACKVFFICVSLISSYTLRHEAMVEQGMGLGERREVLSGWIGHVCTYIGTYGRLRVILLTNVITKDIVAQHRPWEL